MVAGELKRERGWSRGKYDAYADTRKGVLSQKSMSCISRATGQKARYTLIQRLPVAGAYLRSPLSLLHWILGRVGRKTDTTIACWTRPRAMSGHDWAGWPLHIRALEVNLLASVTLGSRMQERQRDAVRCIEGLSAILLENPAV